MIGVLLISQAVGSWPMWAGEASHRSIQLTKGSMQSSPIIKWGFEATGGYFESQFSAIADADDDGETELVIASTDGNIYCFSGTASTLEWSFYTGSQNWSSPAVADVDGDGQSEVITTSAGGHTYCIDGSTGIQKWSFGAGGISSPTIADIDGDGNIEVVFGSDDNSIYCLSGIDGSQKWSFPTGSRVTASPLTADVDDDGEIEVVAGSYDHNLYCLSGPSGSQEWVFSTGDHIRWSAVAADVDDDGNTEVVVGSDDYKVYCLSGSTGAQEWYSSVGDWVWGPPTLADVDYDGNMEVIIGSDNIYCLSGNNGNRKWAIYASGYGSLVDIDGDGQWEYLARDRWNNGTLLCINAEDGSTQWSTYLDYDIGGAFAGDIDDDGCSEIIAGTQQSDDHGYDLFVLDDASGAAGCGTLYNNTKESSIWASFEFRLLKNKLYLLVPVRLQIALQLYDASGRLVQNMFNGVISPGAHTFIPRVANKGTYLALLRYSGGTKTLKVLR